MHQLVLTGNSPRATCENVRRRQTAEAVAAIFHTVWAHHPRLWTCAADGRAGVCWPTYCSHDLLLEHCFDYVALNYHADSPHRQPHTHKCRAVLPTDVQQPCSCCKHTVCETLCSYKSAACRERWCSLLQHASFASPNVHQLVSEVVSCFFNYSPSIGSLD